MDLRELPARETAVQKAVDLDVVRLVREVREVLETRVRGPHELDAVVGWTADPVGAMRQNNEALEEATRSMGIPMLNCIAQPNVNSLQTKYSSLTRTSPDYNQKNKDKNKCNTYQSFANHLWMGQTVMMEESEPLAVRFMDLDLSTGE